MDSLELADFSFLLLLHSLIFKLLFPLFEVTFSLLHVLLEIVISVLKDLLKSLLVEDHHLLLVIEHFSLLLGLLVLPFNGVDTRLLVCLRLRELRELLHRLLRCLILDLLDRLFVLSLRLARHKSCLLKALIRLVIGILGYIQALTFIQVFSVLGSR